MISWTDDGLSWNSTQHNNLETIFVPQTDIWKPDIFLQNGFTKFKELGGSYYYMEVISDGAVLWMPFEVTSLKIVLKQYKTIKETHKLQTRCWCFFKSHVLASKQYWLKHVLKHWLIVVTWWSYNDDIGKSIQCQPACQHRIYTINQLEFFNTICLMQISVCSIK